MPTLADRAKMPSHRQITTEHKKSKKEEAYKNHPKHGERRRERP